MLRNEGDRLTQVVVSTPRKEYVNVRDLKTQNFNEVPDRKKTQDQFELLKSVMADFGCEVIDIPELTGHPNSVFTRDVAVSTPRGYIKLRMGLEARRGEEAWIAEILQSLGEPFVGEITEPGTVEGGDIILAGSVAFVGRSHRTNAEGVGQLSEMLEDLDYEVRVASVEGRYMHIGGAMSVIGPERVIYCRYVFPAGYFEGFDTIEIPHRNYAPSVGNVICLGGNEVIANAAENMEIIKILENYGIKVHGLDLSEFRKGAGGPTCLILPIERQ
ncbi:arginine deiminase family protein [bacterium]|nr:arginine deiminase family protein [bacterium]